MKMHLSLKLNDAMLTLLILVLVVPFSGCASSDIAVLDLAKEEFMQVQQSSLASSQRTFDVNDVTLQKAFVNGFANKNLTVVTLEKDAGFMMAEGAGFLDDRALIKIVTERNSAWASKLGCSVCAFSIPKVTLRISVNFYKKSKNKTITKMKINPTVINCVGLDRGKLLPSPFPKDYCPISSTRISTWYQQLWDEIEKSIFMQRETILN
jgi:hypothetical protein